MTKAAVAGATLMRGIGGGVMVDVGVLVGGVMVGVGVLVVVFFIGYAMADPNSPDTTASTSKYVGAGLITTYVCFFAAIIGIAYTEITKIIK